MQIRREFRANNLLTLTPRGGYTQSWQDRDTALPDSASDVYVGRYNTGIDARQRLSRWVDTTLSYDYAERLKRNRSIRDSEASDRGVEREQLTGSAVARIGRDTRVSAGSGYDLREHPRTEPSKYHHRSERVSPPFVDLQYQARRDISVFFRETYSVFDQRTRTPIRTPLNTAGEIQFGNSADLVYFSQGFSYTKPTFGQDSELLLTNKARFFLTPKWYIDGYLSYRAIANSGVDYKQVHPIEKTIRLVRDLHCWVLRMEFSKRPGRSEASFYIDLKANMRPQKNIFQTTSPSVYGVGREPEIDAAQVFPEPGGNQQVKPEYTPVHE
jgi:hypothetical protein